MSEPIVDWLDVIRLTLAEHGEVEIPRITDVDRTLSFGGAPLFVAPGRFDLVVDLDGSHAYPTRPSSAYVRSMMRDAPIEPSDVQMVPLVQLIRTYRQNGHPVLVHCAAGLNRSGLVAAAVMINEYAHLSVPITSSLARKAISVLREKRHPAVLFNRTFESWLLANESRIALW